MKNLGAVSTRIAIAATLFAGATAGTASTDPNPIGDGETSDVVRMDAPNPKWFYVDGGWDMAGTSIFDSDSGKMKGMVSTHRLANFAIDPGGKYYYVVETMWTVLSV